MITPSCAPVMFGPHITPHCPVAPWWDLSHVTTARLGWWIVAMLLAAAALYWISEQVRDRWELTCGRHRITRRWYGTHAQVRFRAEADNIDADRFVVLAWDSEDSAVPWLKVHKLNPEFCTYWDEDSEPFWAPVTDFAPHAVRKFRPAVTLAGWIPLPSLWKYPLLPYSVRVDGDGRTPEEINTAYYLNMAAWKQPVVFAGRQS